MPTPNKMNQTWNNFRTHIHTHTHTHTHRVDKMIIVRMIALSLVKEHRPRPHLYPHQDDLRVWCRHRWLFLRPSDELPFVSSPWWCCHRQFCRQVIVVSASSDTQLDRASDRWWLSLLQLGKMTGHSSASHQTPNLENVNKKWAITKVFRFTEYYDNIAFSALYSHLSCKPKVVL